VVPKEVLADLPAFVAVAERLNFRAAAEALGLTPAALSKAINRLEDRIGEPLLSRTTRRVELTPAGAAFRGRAVEALQLVADGLTAAALGRRLAGPVRVEAPAVILPLLGGRLADLTRRHPAIAISLCLPEGYARPDLTILLGPRTGRAGPNVAQVQDFALGAVPLSRVASPGYVNPISAAARGRDAVGLYRWLRHDPPLLDPASAGEPDAILTSSDAQSLIAAALAGAGVLTTIRPLVAPYLASGRLLEVSVGDEPAPLSVRAVLTSDDGAVARAALALGAVAQALGLPVPDAVQVSGALTSDAAAPRSSANA